MSLQPPGPKMWGCACAINAIAMVGSLVLGRWMEALVCGALAYFAAVRVIETWD